MKYLIFLIISFSLQAALIEKLQLQNYLAKEIIFHPKNIVANKIVGAQTSWVNVLQMNLLDGSNWCLNFKIPLENSQKYRGELKLIQSLDCSNTLLQSSNYHLKNIQIIEINPIDKSEEFSLKIDSIEYKFSKLKSASILEFNNQSAKLEPVLGAKYIRDNRDLVACHEFNKNCDESIPDKCGECRYGWFSGATSECLGKRNKYCGVAECGELNFPACPRGDKYNEVKAMQGCQNGSYSGFCKVGLEVYCENGQLFCR